MGMSLYKLRESVMKREAWRAAVQGVAELDTTDGLNWTELRWNQDFAPRLHYGFLTAPSLSLE